MTAEKSGSPALDRTSALKLASEFDKERRRSRKVVDHNAHVFHALNSHSPYGSDTPARREV